MIRKYHLPQRCLLIHIRLNLRHVSTYNCRKISRGWRDAMINQIFDRKMSCFHYLPGSCCWGLHCECISPKLELRRKAGELATVGSAACIGTIDGNCIMEVTILTTVLKILLLWPWNKFLQMMRVLEMVH